MPNWRNVLVYADGRPESSVNVYARFAADRQRLLQDDLEKLLASELAGVPRVHAHLLEGDPSDPAFGR
jgi:hypothetical protein